MPVWTGNDHVFGLARDHAGDRMLVLANFSADTQRVHAGVTREHGVHVDTDDDVLVLAPYRFAWLTN